MDNNVNYRLYVSPYLFLGKMGYLMTVADRNIRFDRDVQVYEDMTVGASCPDPVTIDDIVYAADYLLYLFCVYLLAVR